MRIVFSAPIEFDKTGPGTPLGKIAEALRKSSHEILINSIGPEMTSKGYHLKHIPFRHPHQFDEYLAYYTIQAADIFLGTGGSSLLQMQYAVGFGLPCQVATTWFSSHYKHAYEVLKKEYAAWGLTKEPIDPFVMWRAEKEQGLSDLLLVPSRQALATYVKNGVSEERLGLIEFGVDSKVFSPVPPNVTMEHPFRVLFVGGNYMRKGLRFLLDAWRRRLPIENKELLILGCSPEKSVNWPNIRVLGWVRDEQLPTYYRSADVFCLPSLEEGMALSVLEAMASGLPCVVTKETGAPITNGKDGLIIPAGDPRAIADAILYLHDEPDDAAEMGQEGRKTAMKFTWERFQEQVMGHLEGLVES